MLAAAYAVADGGPLEISPELLLARELNRWGVQAVTGRPLYHHELIRLRAAERVISAYSARKNSKSWAEWAQANKQENEYLNYAMKLAGEYGWQHG